MIVVPLILVVMICFSSSLGSAPCNIQCEIDEMACYGKEAHNRCQDAQCMPKWIDDCQNFCPCKCNENEIECQQINEWGCMQPYCQPINEGCEIFCPKQCEEIEVYCSKWTYGCEVQGDCVHYWDSTCQNDWYQFDTFCQVNGAQNDSYYGDHFDNLETDCIKWERRCIWWCQDLHSPTTQVHDKNGP